MKKIIACCDTQQDAESVARRSFAMSTRPSWAQSCIEPSSLPNLFDDGFRKLPYLHDVMDAVLLNSQDSDVIVLCNADICFAPCFDKRLDEAMESSSCAWAHRREFPVIHGMLSDEEVMRGTVYPGIDLFAFTAGWWNIAGCYMPDMVLGAEAWDLCMMHLMQRDGRNPVVMNGVIYHEAHDSVWCRPENIGTLPSQIHNLERARAFLHDEPRMLELLIPNRPT